jgi:hypothetical protein
VHMTGATESHAGFPLPATRPRQRRS